MDLTAQPDFLTLNSQVNLYAEDGVTIQFERDREAVRAYFLQEVNPNTVFFHDLEEKLAYLVEHDYYEAEFLAQYRPEFVKSLFKQVYAKRFRFATFVGAYKFYTGYALKTFDGTRFLERYEDRIAVVALYLAQGSEKRARDLAEEMISQRYQPATPTFLNAGKKQRGEMVSCFPAGSAVETPKGPQAIEELAVGDLVIADDGSERRISSTGRRRDDNGLIKVIVEGSDGPILCTGEHPLLVHRPSGQETLERALTGDGDSEGIWWVEAAYVRRGDFIVVRDTAQSGERPLRRDGRQLRRVLDVSHQAGTNEVYNLEVEERHTYVVGGVVVHNCFLVDIEDSMNSIGRAINTALQLSKRGGGVAFNLTNLRAAGDPIKNVEGQSSGVIPVMKLLEDCFSYADQLGARQGAGAVYLNAHHLDIQTFLDCRREAADEKIRIKTLSLGVVVPDITFELARADEDMYLFSPYDVAKKYGKPFADVNVSDVYRELVDDPAIRKTKMNARRFFQQLAETQFESGYPYLLFEDNANRASPIAGKIKMSNLCVTGETELLTDAGPRRARDLYESGEELRVMVDRRTVAMDPDARGVVEYPAIPMQLTARQAEIFKVETSEGFELRATEWHRMFVLRDGAVVKLPLAEVKAGDRLLIQSGEGSFGTHHDPDLAYIAGQLAGDGTFGHGRDGEREVMRLDLYGEKAEFARPLELAAAGALERHYDREVHHSTSLTPTFGPERRGRRSMGSRPLTEVLAERGVTKATKLRVPDFVKQGTKETVVAYLSGLYQADGSVCGSAKSRVCSIELGSVDRDFLQEVQRLLINLGVFSRIYANRKGGMTLLPDGRGGMREYPTRQLFSLRLMDRVARETFMGLVTLRSASEQRYHGITRTFASRQEAAHRFSAKVVSITPDGVEDVYDTTVADVHSLIFNGICTVNCSEILQVSEPSQIDDEQRYEVLGKDISCNLGSLNISNVMDGPSIGRTVEIAIRALSAVSDMCDISCAPTIDAGNRRSHAVGLGQMNLHGYLGREQIRYDSPEAVDFTDAYFRTIAYHALWASTTIARERGETFDGFENSTYASGEYFSRYEKAWRPRTATVRRLFKEHPLPSPEDWQRLARHVKKYGLYNQNLQAVAPTGSISYVNHATASIHPISSKIESRKEGKMGRVYYPAAHMTNENTEFFEDAYKIGPKALIDVYAAASQHVDQGLSLTLFFTEQATTRDVNRAQIYAWKKGIKTIYYVRVQSAALEGTDTEMCVSCAV